MKFFQVKSVLETKELIAANVLPIQSYETLQLFDAVGRILAEDIVAREHIPAFSRSSVDGYAVKAADTYGASESMPGFLTIAGEVKMGEKAMQTLEYGQAVYVPTGGMIPPGSDAMLMIEHGESHNDLLSVYKQIAPLENIIQAGEDFKKDTVFLQKGTRIRPQELGSLAAQGIAQVSVYRKPIFAYLSTGDEIVSFEEKDLPEGKVRDMNAVTIGSAIQQWGGEFRYGGIIPDDQVQLEAACAKWMQEVDCLILSGGSSVGTKDYSVDVIDSLGKPGVYVHGVSVKPGKPTIISSANGKPVIGLPGHPASALVIFQLFGKQIIRLLSGEDHAEPLTVFAVSEKRIPSSVGRTDYVRVILERRGQSWHASPVLGKSSLISTLVESDGMMEIAAPKEGIEQGEIVPIILFN